MKVLHVVSSCSLAPGYGVSRYIYELARAQARMHHEVHLVTTEAAGTPIEIAASGVTVHRPRETYPFQAYDPHLQTALDNLPMSEALVEAWEAHGPFDVIACHDWTGSLAASLGARVYGCPVVATLHGTEVGRMGGKGTREDLYVADMERWMCERADLVVVPSRAVQREIGGHYQVEDAKTHVIPGGYSPESFAAEADVEEFRSMFAGRDELLVLFAGRLSREKGCDVLLEAIPEALRGRPNARFLIAGDGPERVPLEEAAERMGLKSCVRFAGHLGGVVLGALYRIADLLVVPSRYEALGIVAIEGIAHGVVIVASDCEGLKELATLVGGKRITFASSGNPLSLGREIAQALPKAVPRESSRTRAADSLPEALGWWAVAGRTIGAYEQLISVARG